MTSTSSPVRLLLVAIADSLEPTCRRLGFAGSELARTATWTGRGLVGERFHGSARFRDRTVLLDAVRVDRAGHQHPTWVLVVDEGAEATLANQLLDRVKRAPDSSAAPTLGHGDSTEVAPY